MFRFFANAPDVDGLVDEDVGEPKLLIILVLDQHQVLFRPFENTLLHPHTGILPEEPENTQKGESNDRKKEQIVDLSKANVNQDLRVTSRVICCICSSTSKMFLRFITPLMSRGAPVGLDIMSSYMPVSSSSEVNKRILDSGKGTWVVEGSCRSRRPAAGGSRRPPGQPSERSVKCSQQFETSCH